MVDGLLLCYIFRMIPFGFILPSAMWELLSLISLVGNLMGLAKRGKFTFRKSRYSTKFIKDFIFLLTFVKQKNKTNAWTVALWDTTVFLVHSGGWIRLVKKKGLWIYLTVNNKVYYCNYWNKKKSLSLAVLLCGAERHTAVPLFNNFLIPTVHILIHNKNICLTKSTIFGHENNLHFSIFFHVGNLKYSR